eukprot:TRINITY_DN63109_c0_g1_i1.p1 TRINITY_DN63109_c0_g1~~TRINITY_DN63109_c0_g1_i1.p1  ORF type:complete len:425 (+),score=82.97 TRINITY_DN63109_c0_g1_i1:101-1276(+)
MDQARAMLDALMGPQRDAGKKGKKKDPSDDWKDPSICKNFLAGYCPLAKEDLGGIQKLKLDVCPKIHSELIRERFLKHEDGAPDSKFRWECEDGLLEVLREVLEAREGFAKREKERMKNDPRLRILPDDIQEKYDFLLKKAAQLDSTAETFEKVEYQSGVDRPITRRVTEPPPRRLQEMEYARRLHEEATLHKEEAEEMKRKELKKVAEGYVPRSCEVCGSGCLTAEEFDTHKSFRLHEGYQQVLDKLEELEKAKSQRKDQAPNGSNDRRGKSHADRSRSHDRQARRGGRNQDPSVSPDRQPRRGGRNGDPSRSPERQTRRGRNYEDQDRPPRRGRQRDPSESPERQPRRGRQRDPSGSPERQPRRGKNYEAPDREPPRGGRDGRDRVRRR